MNFIITDNNITVSFDGQLHTISTQDARYSNILQAIKDNRLDDIKRLIDVSSIFDDVEGAELVDGRVKLNGRYIPEALSDKVLEFKDLGLPFKPLLKFSEKILKNPSYNSRVQLYKFLEHNGHPITKDGNFIAYKKVRTDFKDCHTGRIDNSVGTTVSMNRHDVDDNPDNTCSSGLHVAAYNYAKNFSNGHLLEVEVNPEDVVSVPNDYNGEKMRVCKYVVRAICESKLEAVLYDDDGIGYEEESDVINVGDLVEVVSLFDTKYYYGFYESMYCEGDSFTVKEVFSNFVTDEYGFKYAKTDLRGL